TTGPASIGVTRRSCSAFSSACTTAAISPAPASALPSCSASCCATAAASGRTRSPTRAAAFTLRLPRRAAMQEFEHVEILLAEDNPHDAELAIRGLEKHKLANKIVWVKNGEQALDYVFRRGEFEGRSDDGPRLILLDLKMPKVDGIEVTRMVKSDERTRHIPVVIMTSSKEEKDVADSY